jgi:sugar phosphate isomerase/epimerase
LVIRHWSFVSRSSQEVSVKLGVLLAGRRPEDIAKRLEQAREAGFSLCQLNFHQTGLTRADLVAVSESMFENGIRPVSIGCYVNPMRPDDPSFMGACRADLDTILQALDLIGARKIVFWSGTHADSIFGGHPDNDTEESREALREFLRNIVRSTRARHYYLCIEPWHTHVLNSEQKAMDFYYSLEPEVAGHVRFVMDAPNLITEERYADCDNHANAICRSLGPFSGVAHLKDCIMPPDGEASLPGPGQGKLNYTAYLDAIHAHAAPDTPAIVRNVPPTEFAEIRDYLLRQNHQWELA